MVAYNKSFNYAGFSNLPDSQTLGAVVISKLGYQYRIILKFINDTMFVINATRPIAGQAVL